MMSKKADDKKTGAVAARTRLSDDDDDAAGVLSVIGINRLTHYQRVHKWRAKWEQSVRVDRHEVW